MICRHCGKECPEGTKFCIFCGGLLDDPEKEFMGNKFETVEECKKVKDEYNQLIIQYLPVNKELGLADFKKIRERCKASTNEVSTALFLKHIELLEQSVQFKKNSKQAKVAIYLINIGYLVYFFITIFVLKIFSLCGHPYSFLTMFPLVISGTLSGAAWLINLIIILGLSIIILSIIGNIMGHNTTPEEIGYSITFFIGLILAIAFVSGLLGVQIAVLPAYSILFIICIVESIISSYLKNKFNVKNDVT